MGRLEDNPPPSDQTPFQPPSDQTPIQPPPHGYPNHHDNPLSSPQDGYNMVDNNMNTNTQPVSQQPISHPQEQPTAYPQQAQPAAYPQQQAQPAAYPQQAQYAAYPQQAQPAAYPQQAQYAAYPQQAQPAQRSMVADGTSCNPQVYTYMTPDHVSQPQPVINYSVPAGYQPQVTMNVQEWTTGLLDCFDDPENAIMTFCFPCVTFGQIAEIVDNGQTSCATSGLIYSLIAAFVGIPCIMSCSYRTKVRSRYNLIETPAPDWVIHWFCEYCALCQEYRELKNRGMDPALGWQGNLSRQQQMANGVTMAPPINQRMMG